MNDRDNYPRRNRVENAHNEYVELLLNKLRELERNTHPDLGQKSAEGKDHAAVVALEYAGKLVEAVAGWALDHQAGLAMKHLRSVPLQPAGTDTHQKYLESLDIVDDHEHEKDGGDRSWKENCEPVVMRKWLTNVLRTNSGGYDILLRQTAIEALEALDYNETKPILAPTPNARKVNLTELKVQLRAIAFVEYRVACGHKKYEAQKRVANALNVDPSTIRSWEYRLREDFGHLEVSRTCAFAYNSGKNYLDDKERESLGDKLATPEFYEKLYGELALRRLAKDYRDAQRNGE